MMDKERIQQKIDSYREQRNQLDAQYNALTGAIQALTKLLEEEEETEDEGDSSGEETQ